MYIAQQTLKKFPQFKYNGFTTDQLSLAITLHIEHIPTNNKYSLTLTNHDNIIIEKLMENWITEKLSELRDNKINKIINK